MNKRLEKYNRITGHILVILAIFISLSLSFLVFKDSFIHLGNAFMKMLASSKWFICSIFELDCNILPESFIPSIPVDIVPPTLFPDNPNILHPTNMTNEMILFRVAILGELLANKYTYIFYGYELARVLLIILQYTIIIVPVIIIAVKVIKFLYTRNNNKVNHNTLPLKCYLMLSKYTYTPIKSTVILFINTIKDNFAYQFFLILIWILNLNVLTIIFNAINYYLYFSISLDFQSILPQFNVLFYNLRYLGGPAVIVSIPIILYLMMQARKKIALSRLRHFEAKDCGFINELPIVSMTCGSMGKKKTTMLTDMALSQEVMFRQKAFELLQKNDMKFPHFPWLAFEISIQRCMEYGVIFNLASIKEWIKKKQARFEKHYDADKQLYGYDYKRYGLTYDDHLKTHQLFDVLSAYAQLYFIYFMQSSLLVSNYSIREDNVIMSEGNFPIWSTDFFIKRSKNNSRHAHILDFDILRLGKKVLENNAKIGTFEFGVIVITEIGKERGNNLELKELKKSTCDTNQKNDLFNSWLKMCRHSATVDNFPFIKVFTDEQRPESWGADARDLCDIVTIIESGESRIALPFYTIQDMLAVWCYNKFMTLYYDFRYRRGDNTLLVHILKQITDILHKHNERVHNDYGYFILLVDTEQGKMNGKPKRKKYYLMNQKIYSDRFTTDCFSDYFNDIAKDAKLGINDYPEYKNTKATVSELKSQNSYFINSLYKGGDEDGV